MADTLDMDELLEDNMKLERELEKLEIQYLEAKKRNLTQPQRFKAKNFEAINRQASMLGDVTHQSKIMKLNTILSHYLRYGGMMVKEYTSDFCTVLFEISILGKSVAEYAIRLSKIEASDDWQLKSYHLPIAFCLDVVNAKCEMMTTEYFSVMHKALIAHHDRLYQIQNLKNVIPNYAQISNRLNGSLVELETYVGMRDEQNDEIMKVVITLLYDPLESKPNDIEITKFGISDAIKMCNLKEQLQVFRFTNLADGFKRALRNHEHKYYCLSYFEMDEYEKSLNYQKNKISKNKHDRDDNYEDDAQYGDENVECNKPSRDNLRRENSKTVFGKITSNNHNDLGMNYKSNSKRNMHDLMNSDADDYVSGIDKYTNLHQSKPSNTYGDRKSDVSRYSPETSNNTNKRKAIPSKEPDPRKQNGEKGTQRNAPNSNDKAIVKKLGRPRKS